MPYGEQYQRVPIGGHLKLVIEFRNVDNNLFDPDNGTAKVDIINSDQVTILTGESLTKESVGVYYYIVKPEIGWLFGVYRANFYGSVDTDDYESKLYFVVSSNAELNYDWQIMTPEKIIRDYLIGDIGIEYGICKKIQPVTIWHYIDLAINKIETQVQVRLRPVNIVCGDFKNMRDRVSFDSPETKYVVTSDVIEPPYDYSAIDYIQNWAFLQLRERPIISVSKMAFIYPTGQKILDFPKEWIKIYHRAGQVHIVPTAGTIDQALIGYGGQWLPLISGRFPVNVPQLIYVEYTAGMITVTPEYKDMVAKLTCIQLLTIAGDPIVRGITSGSVGIDGVSQSVSFANTPGTLLYAPRIEAYKKDWEEFLASKRTRDKGVIMTVA